MMSNSVTVVIPTYNMSSFLRELVHSLEAAGLLAVVEEVLLVNDGSTDDTQDVFDKIARERPSARIRMLTLHANSGRFAARVAGARAVSTSHILFLDSRVTLSADFCEKFQVALENWDNFVGTAEIDVSRSVFCLYWDRSHRFIFRKHYNAAKNPIVLTEDNYDEYLKGTGVFVCRTSLFIDVCLKYEISGLLSDDTYLLKDLVSREPIVIVPDLVVNWVPRESWGAFLGRLWERGPSFAEYHIFERRGAFFWIVVALMSSLGLVLGGAIAAGPAMLGSVVMMLLLFALASTALFARSVGEFFRLAPLHVAVVAVFGAGILYGIAYNAVRAFRQSLHRRLSI
jgi:glycosyltransferase involved in cell wall biosynthesis